MVKKIKLTAAQATVKYIMAQYVNDKRFIAGAWAIFGHGNVAGLGEALAQVKNKFPTWRGHNEQSMAHIALAFAKTKNRTQTMAVTTSIGPGATNLVTAAATAHANRLPLLLLPGDVFANRAPDPVLQQIENFGDGTISANDCLRPVSRYFDRIARPEQLLTALPRAFATLTNPAECGPVTLAFCQDVQSQAYDYPLEFFTKNIWHRHTPPPDEKQFAAAFSVLKKAKSPLIICGGGVLYSDAGKTLTDFANKHKIAIGETQAGKSAVTCNCKYNFGAIGVTGSSAANAVAKKADVVLAVGTRLQDFTTGSWSLFENKNCQIIALNIGAYDSHKGFLPRNSLPLQADAKIALALLSKKLGGHKFPPPDFTLRENWLATISKVSAAPKDNNTLPSDAQVIGAVQRSTAKNTILLGAAGGLPGELHKLWQAQQQNGYHMEYGYSCMGYEIAGGVGAKMAQPNAEVVVMLGDGSYMMMNSELATSITLDTKIIVVLLDNRGFGCIDRLQRATGQKSFNNLLDTTIHKNKSAIDFVAHAQSMGAKTYRAANIAELESAMKIARNNKISSVIVIDTDASISTSQGGSWWDVAVPEVSASAQVKRARKNYDKMKNKVY